MKSLGLLALLIAPMAIVLGACSGSHGSADEVFCDQFRALGKTYASQQAAIDRRLGKSESPAANERHDRASIRAQVRWYSGLRALQPPPSSGVSAREWRKTNDAERRDLRAVAALYYGKESRKLIRSFHKPHHTPKLPPGTGPTAATIAQAFNSREGRRFARLENKLFQSMHGDYRAWTRLMRKIGMRQACTSHSVTKGATAPATTSPSPGPVFRNDP